MSAKSKRHMGKVAAVPCVLCTHMGLGETKSEVHHLKYGTGASDRSSDYLCIALCPSHHSGPEGVHQLKEHGLYLRYRVSELDLLAMTLAAIK